MPSNYHPATNIAVISAKSRLDAEKNARFLKKSVEGEKSGAGNTGNTADGTSGTGGTGGSATHILAAKVRYGGERFVVGLVINESNGKFFYDHELTEIDALTGGTSEETDAGTIKASVLNVTRNALLSSGFDTKSAKNFRFSVAPVYTGSAADYDKPSLHFVGSGEGCSKI